MFYNLLFCLELRKITVHILDKCIEMSLKWPNLARCHSWVKSSPLTWQIVNLILSRVCVCAQLSAVCCSANISYYCRRVLTSPYVQLQLCMLALTCVFAVRTDSSAIGLSVSRYALRKKKKKTLLVHIWSEAPQAKARAERCRNLRSWHTEALAYFCEGSGQWIYRLFLSMLCGLPKMTHPEALLWITPITLSNAQWLKRGPRSGLYSNVGPNGKNTPRLRTRSYACTLQGLNTTFDKRPKEVLGFS